MSLAAKLPYDHPYAGGYPGIGSQPLPTDADAIDYLTRVASADGAGVEVGVATAVDAFFRDAKESGVFSALKACCILAGARTLAGALVPVVGDAPTNVADGFVEGDFSRTAGLTGDGATTYLDSGRANDDDLQNDQHMAVWITSLPTLTSAIMGSRIGPTETGSSQLIYRTDPSLTFRIHSATETLTGSASVGFFAASRNASDETLARNGGTEFDSSAASQSPNSENVHVFQRSGSSSNAPTDATIAFYSIGTDIGSAGLAALEAAVDNLISAIGEAL